MGRSPARRYGDTAVIFHWLIAVFIIGLLTVGKYMTGLAENDPIRFELTQWHKSFGIIVLLLSILRVIWRFFHKPVLDPEDIPIWQQRVASLVHILLYALMFALPVTGWIMVSTSPLNIDTVLFGVIPWPHLPLSELPDKEAISTAFHHYHHYASMALIFLLLAHIGAALKHHFIDKDGILQRMIPQIKDSRFLAKASCVALLIGGSATLLTWVNAQQSQIAILAAGESDISFVADVTGQETPGLFTDADIVAAIDETNLAASSISARVQTASVTSSDYEVASSLPDEDWFDVKNYPEAVFQSSLIESVNGEISVTGKLTLKGTTQQVSFPMTLMVEDDKQVARGEFLIDRRDFTIGMVTQSDDEYVSFDVLIRFRFEIIPSSAK